MAGPPAAAPAAFVLSPSKDGRECQPWFDKLTMELESYRRLETIARPEETALGALT